ncbi:hypothetical protein BGZ60DRAFT_525866 [Tricladium varicosporioides]|nr:hypothetical protein BGZ60DRAFT_525866 [Hymenoscyphus varicosporioides]
MPRIGYSLLDNNSHIESLSRIRYDSKELQKNCLNLQRDVSLLADIYGAGGLDPCRALCDSKTRIMKDSVVFLLLGVQDLIKTIERLNAPEEVVVGCAKRYELMLSLYKVKLAGTIDLRVVLGCNKASEDLSGRKFLLIGDRVSVENMSETNQMGDVPTFRKMDCTKQHTPTKKIDNMNKITKVVISSSKKSKQQDSKGQIITGTFKDKNPSISSGYKVQGGEDLSKKLVSKNKKNNEAHQSDPATSAIIASDSIAATSNSKVPWTRSHTQKHNLAQPTAVPDKPHRGGFKIPELSSSIIKPKKLSRKQRYRQADEYSKWVIGKLKPSRRFNMGKSPAQRIANLKMPLQRFDFINFNNRHPRGLATPQSIWLHRYPTEAKLQAHRALSQSHNSSIHHDRVINAAKNALSHVDVRVISDILSFGKIPKIDSSTSPQDISKLLSGMQTRCSILESALIKASDDSNKMREHLSFVIIQLENVTKGEYTHSEAEQLKQITEQSMGLDLHIQDLQMQCTRSHLEIIALKRQKPLHIYDPYNSAPSHCSASDPTPAPYTPRQDFTYDKYLKLQHEHHFATENLKNLHAQIHEITGRQTLDMYNLTELNMHNRNLSTRNSALENGFLKATGFTFDEWAGMQVGI